MPRIRTARRRAPARPPAAVVPAYALYGEPLQSGVPDMLHVETIAQRSRLHGFEIGVHRHAALFQILVIRGGRVDAQLDQRTLELTGPCAITVPALAAHGFRFSRDIDGAVFTIAQPQVALLTGALPAPGSLVQLRALAPVGRPLLDAADALRADYAAADRWRALAIDAALRRLLVELGRALPMGAAAHQDAPARALHHVQAYGALVDARFRTQPPLAELANQLGITPTQLNRCCRRVLGRSALDVLHARVLLEAQRELKYTITSIKQIALGLGFVDPGYFTRFFVRHTGRTPSSWRQAGDAA